MAVALLARLRSRSGRELQNTTTLPKHDHTARGYVATPKLAIAAGLRRRGKGSTKPGRDEQGKEM